PHRRDQVRRQEDAAKQCDLAIDALHLVVLEPLHSRRRYERVECLCGKASAPVRAQIRLDPLDGLSARRCAAPELEQPRVEVHGDDVGPRALTQEPACERARPRAEVEYTKGLLRPEQREVVGDEVELQLAPRDVCLLEAVPTRQPGRPRPARAQRRPGAARGVASVSAAAKNATWAMTRGATAGTSQKRTPGTTPITAAPTIG